MLHQLVVGWFTLLALGLGTGAHAQPAPVPLEGYGAVMSLVGAVGYRTGDTDQLTIDDIKSPQESSKFNFPKRLPLLEGSSQPVWFVMRFSQKGSHGDWVLSTHTSSLQDLRFYGPFNAAGVSTGGVVLTGSLQPYFTRPLHSEMLAARLRINDPGEYTMYVRATSLTARVYDFRIMDIEAFHAQAQDKRIFDGISYGILFAMLVYNLMLLIVFRDRTYSLYVISVLMSLATVASFNGHVQHYLFPAAPVLADRFSVVFPALWIFFGAWFGYSFLDLRRFAPLIGKGVVVLACLSAGSAALGALGKQLLSQTANEHIAMVATAVMFAGAVQAWRKGFLPARWYIAGQFALFSTVVVSVLINWGHVDWPWMADNGLQVGVSVEVLVFAVALSSRIRLMQSVQAELKVRTEQLTVASETDPLTGAANRAGLAQQASQVLTHLNERTLILLDLDKFKPINDLYGHDAGDAVLVEIARRIKGLLRAEDTVARVGGDEFVVLLNQAHDRTVLEHISNRLLDSIAQPVAFSGKLLTVGGSLGIARYPGNGLTLPDLMQAADVAMYHIKKNGRAGYAFFDDVPNPPPAPVSG